jgi:hypothetical protein
MSGMPNVTKKSELKRRALRGFISFFLVFFKIKIIVVSLPWQACPLKLWDAEKPLPSKLPFAV